MCGQPSQLCRGVLLSLEHEPWTGDMEVDAIPSRKSKRASDVRRYHEATLLTEHECGIHSRIMPRYPE